MVKHPWTKHEATVLQPLILFAQYLEDHQMDNTYRF